MYINVCTSRLCLIKLVLNIWMFHITFSLYIYISMYECTLRKIPGTYLFEIAFPP